MRSKIILAVLPFSLTAMLSVGISNPAIGAACSKRDKLAWSGDEMNNLNYLHTIAYILVDDEKIDALYERIDSWKKSTKSKKLKSALAAYEKQLDTASGSGMSFKAHPKLQAALATIRTIVERNRC